MPADGALAALGTSQLNTEPQAVTLKHATAGLAEAAVATVFMAVTLVGFKYSLWLVAGALASHGIFDLFHGQLITNPGVPVWWPPFRLAYDGVAAGYLAFLLRRA